MASSKSPRWRSRSTTGWCGSATPTGSTSLHGRAGRRDQARPGRVLPRRRARASSTRCASGRACCTGSPRGWPTRRCTRSGCPAGAPDWVETVQLYFPRWGRTADELCVTELGSVIWAVQMSTVEFHPWNSRRADTEKPDEWRIDLDPGDECDYATVQRVAHVVARGPRRARRGRLPEDQRRQGDARLRAGPPRARLQGRTPRRAGLRARGRAAYAGRRHHHLVAQGPGPAQALRGLQPERPRPHHRRGVLRPRPARRPGLRPHPTGTRSTTPTRATSRSSPCPPGSPRMGDLHDAIDEHVFDLRPLLEWAERDEARGRGDTRGARDRD